MMVQCDIIFKYEKNERGKKVQKVINGGIYRVVFSSTNSSEFNGPHPAVIIRTLKENEIYLVVPLTTYTKEKMDKARRVGFGKHIFSTNSIARIDKIQVIHIDDIKGRWIDSNGMITKMSTEELTSLNEKLCEYIDLSSDKCEKEYSKYETQYAEVFTCLQSIVATNFQSEQNLFNINNKGTAIELSSSVSNFYWLTKKDLEEIAKATCKSGFERLDFVDKVATIRIKLIDKE